MATPKSRIEIDYTVRERELLVRRAICDLIRTQRKRRSVLTQERLADLSEISFEHLNHIENYKSGVSVEVLERIARALGFVRLSEFLALDEHEIL
ncbi:MAG TPA: helix-turn-helix transcriptional regulator [Pyrinomonadaceae bacterium]|nr:helix-turn-helix transcriptional regulator [Pyrinomonadaceae bacterium]